MIVVAGIIFGAEVGRTDALNFRPLARLGLPTVFVLEGGYAAAELGTNAVNVLDGFEQA